MPNLLRAVATALFIFVPAVATAQPTPTFTAGNREEVKAVEKPTWTATAEAGLVLTTGNSRTTTATAAAKVIRLDPRNKLEATLAAAYARSTILVATDDGDGFIEEDEIDEQSTNAAESWQVKVRYDRFLTDHDALYVAALAAADQPAGKELGAGGQLGYSRRLFRNDHHEVLGEAGYDLSYENPVVGDAVTIHSARIFAGYSGTIRTDTALAGSVEALSNVNRLATSPTPANPFDDTPITGLALVTTKLTDDIALSVSVTAKYDGHPLALAPFALPYAAGFEPLADQLDTITKASLIITLL